MAKAKSLSPDIEDLIRRQTECIKGQMEKIAALEAENARIAELESTIAILKGGLEHAGIDAVLFLRSVYNNPEAPLNLQIQAAATVAKINAAPKVNVGVVLFDKLEQARLRRAAQRLEAKTIDAEPGPAA
jgi:hypothetical protein